ncbi:MAG: sulfatase [Verrucomicrobiaceae bacterium]
MIDKSLLPLVACIGFACTSYAEQPNVLLIMVDDLNDYTGYLGGHPQAITPNMDALAASGTRFVNAHTNAPICAPSRASLFTGVYPHTSHNYWFDEWNENEVLKNCKPLGQFMKDNGYQTYGTGKLMHTPYLDNWTEHGIDNYPGPFPFDGKKPTGHPSIPEPFRNLGQIDGVYASLADVPNVPASGDRPGHNGWVINWRTPFKYVSEDDRDLMNDEIQANWTIERMQKLAKQKDDKPFFLAVGFIRPHTPLVAPQKYFDMYPLETLKLAPIKENDRDDTYFETILQSWTPKWYSHYSLMTESYEDVNEGLLKHLQAYLACVTFVDDQVGKVLDALEKSPFKDNTIVILASDHGYHQGEKQYLYKNSLWEEATRVPLIIRTPAIEGSAGQTIEHPVALIDIYPTIADLCGLADKDNKLNKNGVSLDGHSLKPFLKEGENAEWSGPDVALTMVMTPRPKEDPIEHSYAARSKDYRYISYVSGREELYDHTNDPREWTNQADNPQYAEIKAELKGQIEALVGGDLDQRTFEPTRTK